MKPLIVILLLAVSVQAQTLADLARKERQRQAGLKARVLSIEGVQSAAPAADAAKPGDAADEKAVDRKAAAAAKEGPEKPAAATVSAPPKPPGPDPAAAWNAELDKLRARIRQLQDQETALQLQVNQLNNQIFAAVVDPAAQKQAQTRLGTTQQQLAATRTELDQTKKTLDGLQLQGPKK